MGKEQFIVQDHCSSFIKCIIHAAAVRSFYPFAVFIKCATLSVHTLHSLYMQAIKWRLCWHSHELVKSGEEEILGIRSIFT
jgi:hypothetical protein